MSIISLYSKIEETKPIQDLSLEKYYDRIQSGFYEDIILPLREKLKAATSSDERNKLKSAVLPYVTPAGKFSARNNAGLIQPSGELHMDIDGENPEAVKEKVKNDKTVRAVYESCSATGAVVAFKINPLRYADSFDGIAKYLFVKYGLVVDQKCKALSQPRFVTADRNIILNDKAELFKEYLPKQKLDKKEPKKVVFVQSDFEYILSQITFDITGDYNQWLRIGFAIADKFGEDGRDYFHTISEQGSSYTVHSCNKQYTACIEGKNEGITIASFYWICKQNNIRIVSETVLAISKTVAAYKKANRPLAETIAAVEGDKDLVADIATQIYSGNISISEVSDIESAKIWLVEKKLRFNVLTESIEDAAGKELTERQLNGLEIEMKDAFENLHYPDITRIIKSEAIPSYHPLLSLLEPYATVDPEGYKKYQIDELFSCIKSPMNSAVMEKATILFSEDGTESYIPAKNIYVQALGTKWLVGAIANLHPNPKYGQSPLVLWLCGENKGIGKSFFFDNILPKEISKYSKRANFEDLGSASAKKDFEVSQSQNWLIWHDEQKDGFTANRGLIDSLLSATSSKVRAAYGRKEETRQNIAFFGAATNNTDVIPDGGNRRLIAIETFDIDRSRKDAINPLHYFIEAYRLYLSGYDYRIVSQTDIDELHKLTSGNRAVSNEQEAFYEVFRAATPEEAASGKEWKTATMITDAMNSVRTNKPFTPEKVGKMLSDKYSGIIKDKKRINGSVGVCTVYAAIRLYAVVVL